MANTLGGLTAKAVGESQLQKSADGIARAIAHELPKLVPVERRELLMQTVEWIRGRIAAFDEAARRAQGAIVAPTATEQSVVAKFGKGYRTTDLAA